MPASQARSERRKRAREGISRPTQFATVEDAEDEEGAKAGLAQATEARGARPRVIDARGVMHRLDLSGNASLPPPSFSPTKQHHGSVLTALKKKSKSHTKHGHLPQVAQPSEHPQVWENAMQTLETMTPAETQLLREKIIDKMKEEMAQGLWPPPEKSGESATDAQARGPVVETPSQPRIVNGPTIKAHSDAATVAGSEDELPTEQQARGATNLTPDLCPRPPRQISNPKLDNDSDDTGAVIANELPNVKFDLSKRPSRPPTQRKPSHHRSRSTDLTNGIGAKPPFAFRAHRLTNDGMLELKASSSKDGVPAANEQKHRRRISLNLPVNVSQTQLVNPSPPTIESLISRNTERAALEKAERELEYKHRHTFIGTASLDDFLDIVDVSPTHTTTKCDIAQTFILLASIEQLDARQSSSVPDGWEFVTRTTHDVAFGYEDYLNQAHVKLGSISLKAFLKMIPFDVEENVGAMSLVEAFCAASHLDAKQNSSAGSKAKSFRSWMVRREVA